VVSGCCDGVTGETLVFTCAGAAHCGQVANRAGVQLTQDRVGQLFCLAAMSAGIPEKVARARNAAVRVAIDGCEDHCARKTLDISALPVDVHLELTAVGIEKKPANPSILNDMHRAVGLIKAKLADRMTGTP
jgi:uncharacterized metal-binding protein